MSNELRIARSFTRRYLIGLTLMALLSTGAYISLNLVISSQEFTAAVVNVSGRQRMLSQRTALFSEQLVNAPVSERPAVRMRLQEAIELMQTQRRSLVDSNSLLRQAGDMSPEIQALYFDGPKAVDKLETRYIGLVNRLLVMPDDELRQDNPVLAELLALSRDDLLKGLDKVVGQYQREGEASVHRLQAYERGVWVAALSLLVMEAFFIFQPFARQMRRVIRELEEAKDGLKAHQATLEDQVAARTKELLEREQQLKKLSLVVEQSPESIVITNTAAEIEYVNEAFIRNTGYTLEEVVGRNPRILQSGKTPPEVYADLWETLSAGKIWRGEFHNRRKDDSDYIEAVVIAPTRQEDGQITHYVAVKEDITKRKQAEEEIRHLAYFDSLTQLPNRRLLIDRLGQALTASNRSREYGAVIMLDLDHFKRLNDSLGHEVGDQLLVQVANRLQTTVRQEDTVSRLGGDEFVVMIEGLGKTEKSAATQAEQVAEKIRDTLARPYRLANADDGYRNTTSIGLTLFRGNDTSIDLLLKQADVALYQAKDAGRDAVRFFNEAMQAAIDHHIATEKALRQALTQGEFLLYFQPQVNQFGERIGAEALVRWRHPVRGMVSPAEFIPIAEEMGLIVEIGQLVMDMACKQLKRWEAEPRTRSLQLAVNVSARQFHQPDFVERLKNSLAECGTDPSRLKLELTESIILENVDGVIARMNELNALGVSFSLDDFGTGYSSLSYLKRLPLSQVKIDQSFVREIPKDRNDAAIVKAILAMSQSLGIGVIAEGVENIAQRDFLFEHGCVAYQGYLFGKPMPVEEWDEAEPKPAAGGVV